MSQTVPQANTRVEMTQLVLPTHTNNHGTIFGGQLAAWIDTAAAVSAMRFGRGDVVTASMDELHFLRPVNRGMIVTLRAQVNQAWRSSMEIGVQAESEDPGTGERKICCTAYLTFVALTPDGRPRPLPGLVVDEPAEGARRRTEAEARRAHRLQVRESRRQHT
jgi:acyl-CoA hydrolase